MQFALTIDRRSGIPLRRQICDGWRQAILTSRLRPGDRLPSTRELAALIGVARGTVTDAYDELTAEGYLEPAGRGTFVARHLQVDVPSATRTSSRDTEPQSPVRLSRYGRQLEAGRARPPERRGVINLSKLSPALDRFPFALWRRSLARHVREDRPDVFDYSDNVCGHEGLRVEIAGYLARSRAVRCTPDQVVVVNSSQQALDLCARVLVDPGDEVVVEEPGYDRARELFAAHGARLRPVPVTPEGISLDHLGNDARLAYVTPSHQFPVGVSMSVARRLALVEWARSTGAVLVEDDYDSEFRYIGAPLPAMQSLGRGVPIVYVGTFSKVLFPGLRIGYVVVPRELATPFARAKRLSDRHTAMLEQAALADFMRDGHLTRHIRRMRKLYAERRSALVESLARWLGSRVTIHGEPAGLHLLATLRPRARDLSSGSAGVTLMNAAAYYSSRAPKDTYIMGFSAVTEREIREGVRRLAKG